MSFKYLLLIALQDFGPKKIASLLVIFFIKIKVSTKDEMLSEYELKKVFKKAFSIVRKILQEKKTSSDQHRNIIFKYYYKCIFALFKCI